MKRINRNYFKQVAILGVVSSTLLVACSGNGGEVNDERGEEQLNAMFNNMVETSKKKDSTINSFVSSLNEIQANLDEIKEREGVIELTSQNPELDQSQQEKVLEDMRLINDLMQRNRETIANLRKRLDRANEDLKDSDLKLDEMSKVIESLNKRISDKDQEILALQSELADLNFQLESLEAAYTSQAELVVTLDKELNTAYYSFGSYKELKEEGVITKEGGFIGLGKSKKLKDDFNKSYFTQIDILDTREIPILSKKAKLITTHPTESYELVGEGKVDKIVIHNPKEFWSASKYLVIVVE